MSLVSSTVIHTKQSISIFMIFNEMNQMKNAIVDLEVIKHTCNEGYPICTYFDTFFTIAYSLNRKSLHLCYI